MRRIVRLLTRARRDDAGSALILALIIVVAVGILLSTALSFAGSGLLTAPKTRDLRNQTYYAQGAVDGAINNIRGSSIDGTFLNGSPGPCRTYSPDSLVAGQDLGADGTGNKFRATCTGVDSGSEPGSNAPVWAIQTLGHNTAPGDTNGINTTGNDTLTVDGGIFSAGRVNAGGGSHNQIVVEGSIYAVNACTPANQIFSTDPAGLSNCNRAQTLGADPHYAPAIASNTALNTFINTAGVGADPDVNCHGGVAWFTQGYYDELPSTLVADAHATRAAASNCTGTESVFWFAPGFYYFDFTNAADGPNWAINQVVGGTANTAAGDWTNGSASVPWGSACKSDTNADSTPKFDGVQFIFGGNSTISMGNDNKLELCGPQQSQHPGSPQSIAVFGLGGDDPADAGVQGTGSSPGSSSGTVAATGDPTPAPATAFLPASAATKIDGTSTLDTVLAGNATATLTYPGFNIPPGSHITSVSVVIARTISAGTLGTDRVTLTLPNNQTADANVTGTCTQASPCEIPVTLPNGGPAWKMTATYTAKAKNTGATVSVDGVALKVNYTSPVLEPLTPNHGTFISAGPTASPHVTMQMHGTLYTPGVGMGVWDQSSGNVVFSRGVILYTLLVGANPSFTQTAAPFQVPGVKASRLVKFIGSVSTDGGSTWTDVVQACVKFNDNNSSGSPGAALPGYTLGVKHWTVLRSGTGAGPPCT